MIFGTYNLNKATKESFNFTTFCQRLYARGRYKAEHSLYYS